MTTNRSILNAAERYRVTKALDAVLIQDGDGYVKYSDGVTDESMAASVSETLGRPYTATAVKEMRQAVFGKLRRNGNPNFGKVNLATVQAEIAALRERVERLERDNAASPTIAARNGAGHAWQVRA